MITTDFFTHCCKNQRNELLGARWAVACALFVLWACLALVPRAAATETVTAQVSELRLERKEDGLYLGTTMQFVLPELAEDALYKGIPMFFVAEAQVLRERW